ncbi:uncharacterized protein LOC127358540 isoform X1 [Dicentrarchus labrax]|uniref:uncharacterized protein LOC127358540 isoform X1 n=1 Tax=Dicentrarchus labrax TaxID=13489 RepID=UPI0021F67D50|nr:uncharacterized protein LOC127358540 isoform X1 [Dicentrarchus labrax]XP_051247630.1 uncharacterized protein LOC127358540 isoform X1 [Dicentrarchus labrax]
MQSGFPHSQGGAYPAVQHWRALTSFQDNNVTPVPLVHPANGIQNNVVATQYPGELRVSYNPAQWQQDNTQSQQHFQGLYHQLESQASNAFRYSSAHASAQHGDSFGTSANENSVRQSVYNTRQQRECSKQKGSNWNTSNCSAALQGDTFGHRAQTLQDQLSSVPESHPLLYALLKGNCESEQVKSSLAAINCGKTSTKNLDYSGGTHSVPCQQQVSSPPSQTSTENISPAGEMVPSTNDPINNIILEKVLYFRGILQNRNYGHKCNKGCSVASDKEDVKRQSLNCAGFEQSTAAVGQAPEEESSRSSKENTELTSTSEDTGNCATSAPEKHLPGTLTSPAGNSKHSLETESFGKNALVDLDLPVKKHLDITMPANGDGKLVYSGDYEDETFVSSNDESKWCDKYLENGMTTLHYSLTALKELIASLENVETIAEMDNLPKVILQQYWNGDIDNINLFTFTEYPQIMVKVAATCAKNEDESPVVLTTVPGVTFDELTEKHPSSTRNSGSSQEENKSLRLNINKNLDDQMAGVSWALKPMTEREKGGLKPVETVGLDNVQGVTDVSDLQTMSCSGVFENETFEHTSFTETDAYKKRMKEVEDQQHCEVICKEVIKHSKLNSSIDNIRIDNVLSIPGTSHGGAREDAGSVHILTDVSIALSENKVEEHSCPSKSEGEEALSVINLQYEEISDDEGISQLATELPKTEHKELSFQVSFGNPQYEDISEDDNTQTENMAMEVSSFTVHEPNNKQAPFENESYGHMQGQAQMQTEIISDEELIPKKVVSPVTETLDIAHCPSPCSDDWMVIPISMADLKFEPEDEDLGGPEEVVLNDGGETVKKETQCVTSPTRCELQWPALEAFDTVASFLQQKGVQFKTLAVVPATSAPENDPDCEKEPHTPQDRRASYPESEDSCETEDSCDYSSDSEHNILTVSTQRPVPPQPNESCDTENSCDYPASLSPPLSVESVSEDDDEDDDTDVQKGQTRFKQVQHKKNGQIIDTIIIDSDTEDESDEHYKKKAKAKRLFTSGSDDSEDVPFSQQNRHSPQTVDSPCGTVGEVVMQDECSESVQHNGQISKNEDVINLVSDTEDDEDKNVSPCVQQKRQSPQAMEEYGTFRGTRLFFADSSLTQHQSKLVSEERKKANPKIIRSSGSKDSDATKIRPPAETVDRLCGIAKKKPKTSKLSSEDSQKMHSLSADNEAESTLGPTPVVPRLFVLKSAQPNNLKLSKESRDNMHGDGKTQAPKTGTSKKTDFCENSTQYPIIKKQVRFVFKPKPPNDRHRATKNIVQTNVAKPILVSRPQSLPDQEGPSTSSGCSSSTSGQHSEARQSPSSSRALSQSGKTSASSSLPRQQLSSSKLQRSNSNPSTLDHHNTPTEGPSFSATRQSSAKKQVKKAWESSHVPTRIYRKSYPGTEEDSGTPKYNLVNDARLGHIHDWVPRRRHGSNESTPHLLKKSKSDAIQWTRATNRDTANKQRSSAVSKGYKWSEKPTVAKPTRRYRR